MYYLSNYVQLGRLPVELLDINIAANFTKLGNLLTLKGNNVSKEILEKAIQNQKIEGKMINKFELETMPINEQVIQSLLFYFGYLTKKEAVEKKREEALKEIQAYSQDERLLQEDMKKFIVIYVGKRLELLEEII